MDEVVTYGISLSIARFYENFIIDLLTFQTLISYRYSEEAFVFQMFTYKVLALVLSCIFVHGYITVDSLIMSLPTVDVDIYQCRILVHQGLGLIFSSQVLF